MSADLLPLRDYQRQAIDALWAGWAPVGPHRRQAVVLPTGAGKTVIFSHLAREHHAWRPDSRVVILAHTDELVTQAARKLRDVAPHLSVGIVKAERNEVTARVVVASVQSLRSPRRLAMLRSVGLIIVDECHHSAAATYQTILGAFPDALVAGFTATLARSDNLSLGKTWESVAYRKSISFMIRAGYLVDVRGKRVEIPDLDLRKVKRSGGDFQSGDLGEALTESLAPELVAKAYAEHATERQGILFAPTVDAAYEFSEAFNGQGIVTETIHGALPLAERRDIIDRLNSGRIQVVSNCMVLTEGFDSPAVSCVVVARPTKSSGLYQQMVGRGLRVNPTIARAGQDCLILDVVGASAVHGLASLIDLSDDVKVIRDGQSIIEAEDMPEDEWLDGEEGVGALPRGFHFGPTAVVDFDPLASASKRVWLKTKGGTWFLSGGTGEGSVYVFVVPACEPDAPAGTWDVLWAAKSRTDKSHHGKPGDFTEHRGVSLELAFAWGEEVAHDMAPFGSVNTLAKSASWRKGQATAAQVSKARQMGIVVPEDATKGEVSELIDSVVASDRIDPIAAHFARR